MCVFERNHLTVTENQVRFLPFLESPKVPSIIEDKRELLVLPNSKTCSSLSFPSLASSVHASTSMGVRKGRVMIGVARFFAGPSAHLHLISPLLWLTLTFRLIIPRLFFIV